MTSYCFFTLVASFERELKKSGTSKLNVCQLFHDVFTLVSIYKRTASVFKDGSPFNGKNQRTASVFKDGGPFNGKNQRTASVFKDGGPFNGKNQ